ncbi:uncharacterized protein UDID_19298 [Ustilago sp. UG-2017a]|nr:uncharacterized protein UDID_19298 [Ustilago sp. UG-2017a]SPC64960.1 uncharacterized protein UHOD_12309 [Ustilago sp. UG-2017b]
MTRSVCHFAARLFGYFGYLFGFTPSQYIQVYRIGRLEERVLSRSNTFGRSSHKSPRNYDTLLYLHHRHHPSTHPLLRPPHSSLRTAQAGAASPGRFSQLVRRIGRQCGLSTNPVEKRSATALR